MSSHATYAKGQNRLKNYRSFIIYKNVWQQRQRVARRRAMQLAAALLTIAALCGQADAASICIGGYCESNCDDGVNWCWYANSGGQPSGTQIAQVNPPFTPALPTTTMTATSAATPTLPPPTDTPTPSITATPTPVPVAVISADKKVTLTVTLNGVQMKCSATKTPAKTWTCHA